jgi:hypothetical protein
LTQAPTVDDIRRDLDAGFNSYLAELQQAGPNWDRKPLAGEGEDAWSARQVAEHIAGSLRFFGAGIARALGVEGPALQRFELPSVDQAVTATRDANDAFMSVVGRVSEESLAAEIEDPRMGKFTVESILGIAVNHFGDHRNQLKALREG